MNRTTALKTANAALTKTRISYSTELKEYRVWLKEQPEADYFTNDLEDAIATAKLMEAHVTPIY